MALNESLTLISFLTDFAQDQRTMVLLGLVFLDFMFGTAASLRMGVWNLHQVGNWYLRNIMPYIICYFGLYVVTRLGVGSLFGPFVGDISAYMAAAPATISLYASIRRNIQVLFRQSLPK